MYVPAAFAETDTAKLHEFMWRHGFAVLTSNGRDSLVASHLPLLLDPDAGSHGHLLGHMLRAIVGFRIEITRLEGKWKLSQNHPEERRRRVIRALEARPDDDSQEIAGLMSALMNGSALPNGS